MNEEISKLAALAVAQNAPVTLVNHASGYHGFEMFNDDDATREVMEQTIAFVRRATLAGVSGRASSRDSGGDGGGLRADARLRQGRADLRRPRRRATG